MQDSVRSRSQQPCSLLGAANRRNGRNRSKGGSGERQGRPGGGGRGRMAFPARESPSRAPLSRQAFWERRGAPQCLNFLTGCSSPPRQHRERRRRRAVRPVGRIPIVQGCPVRPRLSWFPATEASRSSGGSWLRAAEGPWRWRYSLRHSGFTQAPWSSEQACHLHKLGGEVAVWGYPRHGSPGAARRASPSPKHKACEKPGGVARVSGV